MKKLAKANKVTIDQAGIKLHKLEIDFDVSEIWLWVKMELNKDRNAPMDFFNEELIKQCELVMWDVKILYEEKSWEVKAFNKYSLATFIANVTFSAFDSLSSNWVEAFKVLINEAKDTLREYEKRNWPILEKVSKIEEWVTRNTSSHHGQILTELHEIKKMIKGKDTIINIEKKEVQDVSTYNAPTAWPTEVQLWHWTFTFKKV